MRKLPCSSRHTLYLQKQRRLFRKTHWFVICRDCPLKIGPYESAHQATVGRDMIAMCDVPEDPDAE